MDATVPKPEQAQRLVEARIKRGFKDAKAAAVYFGWKYNSYAQHESGLRGLRKDTAERYARAYRVSPAWLLTGEGEGKIELVPLVSWVSAGAMADPMSQIPMDDVPLLAFADLSSGDWFALRVIGDSMDRVSPDGSVILVNRNDRDLYPGRKYVFAVRGEATYKQWESGPPRLEPVTTNPDANKSIFPHGDTEYLVVGRVRRTILDL